MDIKSSLLLVLDEKNNVISKLRAQINNQKVQLKYYIRRSLRHLQLNKLKVNSSVDQGISVDLALTKFFKDHGVKSKLRLLYERMFVIDKKISLMLSNQQLMLRQIMGNVLVSPEMLSALMQKTVRLTRILEIFRVCCDRVILSEDEKMSIVEHVFSLPLKQRLETTYLAGVYQEKKRLEDNVRRVLKEQKNLRRRIKDIIFVDGKLKKFGVPSDIVLDKLKDLNFEAEDLLGKTQKRSLRTQQVINVVRIALKNLKIGRFEIPVEFKEENQDLYKQVLSLLDFEVNFKAVRQFNGTSNQCVLLKNEVEALSNVRDKLLVSLRSVEEELRQVKLQQKTESVKNSIENKTLRNDVTKLEKTVELYKNTINNKTEELNTYKKAIQQKNLKIRELLDENEKLQDMHTKNEYQLKYLMKINTFDVEKTDKELKDLYHNKVENFGSCTEGSNETFVADPLPKNRKKPKSFPHSLSTSQATRSPKCCAINEHQSFPNCYRK